MRATFKRNCGKDVRSIIHPVECPRPNAPADHWLSLECRESVPNVGIYYRSPTKSGRELAKTLFYGAVAEGQEFTQEFGVAECPPLTGILPSFESSRPLKGIEIINLDGLPEAEALRLLGVDEKGNDVSGDQSSAGLQPAQTPPTPSPSTPTQSGSTLKTKTSDDGQKPPATLGSIAPTGMARATPSACCVGGDSRRVRRLECSPPHALLSLRVFADGMVFGLC